MINIWSTNESRAFSRKMMVNFSLSAVIFATANFHKMNFFRHPVVTQNSYSFINFGSYIICMAFRTFVKFLNCLITISCSWGKCFYWKLFDPCHGASRPTLATAAIFNTIPVVHCTVYQWNATWNCIFCSK